MVKSSTRVQRKLAKKAAFTNEQEQESIGSKHGSVNTGIQREKQQGQRLLERKAKKEQTHHHREQQQKKKLRRTDNSFTDAMPTALSKSDKAKSKKKMSNQVSDQQRRVAEKLVAREQQQRTRLTAAEARMETAKAELALFDEVTQIPSFVENPFLAIEGHLNDTMSFLQPQTPDVGRVKRVE
ncbi:hypothetical protein LSM04_004945 [Trypanosoma melophagium]|uniref:uncharacterized protein n=1 Tax=Trypanosoma melophagium TaxID=715481 RepID=UPI00351A95AA|nr:hypothetical protein LSM04_004945 [Trypanosoma melophagium]